MMLGYARVSTDDQNLDRQIDQLKKANVEAIYKEKLTGTRRDRPQLIKLLAEARKGDTIVIVDLTRLSRSTKDLISISEMLQERGINLVSLKDNLDTTSATGKLMFGMLSIMAQFERDIISERTKEGLASARARGRLGGRIDKLTDLQKRNVIDLFNKRELTVQEIADLYNISRPTVYRTVDKAIAPVV